MMFAYIDGDDIGLRIENCFMNNDVDRLSKINNEIKSLIDNMTASLQENGYKVIFGGADGIIVSKDRIEVDELLAFVRGFTNNFTFSIGVGEELKESYIALRYAKSNGKDIAAFYDSKFTLHN